MARLHLGMQVIKMSFLRSVSLPFFRFLPSLSFRFFFLPFFLAFSFLPSFIFLSPPSLPLFLPLLLFIHSFFGLSFFLDCFLYFFRLCCFFIFHQTVIFCSTSFLFPIYWIPKRLLNNLLKSHDHLEKNLQFFSRSRSSSSSSSRSCSPENSGQVQFITEFGAPNTESPTKPDTSGDSRTITSSSRSVYIPCYVFT